jgi:chitinase
MHNPPNRTNPLGKSSAPLPDEPRRRLSVLRLFLALVVLLGAGAGVALAVRNGTLGPRERASAAKRSPQFAPYVDVTLTPPYAFQDESASPVHALILGFVVSSPQQPCVPTWGGYYGMDQAGKALDLDRRVAQSVGQGTQVIASFGGQANKELASACTKPAALTAAYQSVLDRYHVAGLDFDIEGSAVSDAAAVERRAQAIRVLQEHRRGLPVWLTLPLAADGLPPGAIDSVRRTLAAGVTLAGVNLLAMDYGPPVKNMFKTTRAALQSAHAQLAAVYASARIRLSSAQLWNRLGATIMIGQNDSNGEQFTTDAASSLAAFAASAHLGRLSIWSLNRDRQCGVTFPLVGTHSNLCSGVRQTPLQFTNILRRRANRATPLTATPAGTSTEAATPGRDDPARSPYPIWQPARMYQTHYKVVWHRAVYEARYFSQGQPPDQASSGPGPGAWQLLGPVLATDRAPTLPRLKEGTYPDWSPHVSYRQGDRVLVDRLPYVAKWYTVGTPPNSESADPSAAPWKALFRIPGEPGS